MRSRLTVLFALLAALALAAPAGAPAAKKKPRPPTVKVVKKLLYDHYGEGGKEDSMGARHTFKWQSVRILKGHRAKPPELFKPGTWVWPSRAKWTRTTVMSGGTTMVSRFDAKIFVYRDDFGEWAFTNDTVKHENVKCTQADGTEFECP